MGEEMGVAAACEEREADGAEGKGDEAARLRRLVALAHRRTRACRRHATRVLRAARTLYPLALATRPGLALPDCLVQSLPPLPPLPSHASLVAAAAQPPLAPANDPTA